MINYCFALKDLLVAEYAINLHDLFPYLACKRGKLFIFNYTYTRLKKNNSITSIMIVFNIKSYVINIACESPLLLSRLLQLKRAFYKVFKTQIEFQILHICNSHFIICLQSRYTTKD